MNIAVCVNTLSAGGAESFAVALAIEYAKMGNKVIVVVHNIVDEKGEVLKSQLEAKNITLYNADIKHSYEKLILPLKYSQIFRIHKIEIIHSHLEQTDTYVLVSKLFYRKPHLIRTLHSKLPFSKYPHCIHRLLFKSFKFNIGCGDAMVNDYYYADLRHNLIPINNGIDIDCRSNVEKAEIRKKYRALLNISHDDIVFLQVGTMSPRFGGVLTKGHDLSMAALNKIKSSRIKFIFVGNNDEASNARYYNQEFASDNRIIYTGIVGNVKDYIHTSDVIIAPSRTEGLPISTMECVVEGKPLICSSIKQFSLFYTPATLVFDITQIDSFVSCINEMVNNYSDFLKSAEQQQVDYINRFSISRTAQEYLHIIDKL